MATKTDIYIAVIAVAIALIILWNINITERVDELSRAVSGIAGGGVVERPIGMLIANGSLSVTSTPSSATLYVDNVKKGITPMIVSGLSAGKHSVKLTKTGYYNYTTTVNITAGQTTTLSVTLTPIITCTDSDGGIVKEIRGTTSRRNMGTGQIIENKTDLCVTSSRVHEFYCSGNIINETEIICAADERCWDALNAGACQKVECVDSDGGRVYDVYGTTSGLNSSGTFVVAEDYCPGSGKYRRVGGGIGKKDLVEYYCDSNNRVAHQSHTCVGVNVICAWGRCINMSATTTTTIPGGSTTTTTTRGGTTTTTTICTDEYCRSQGHACCHNDRCDDYAPYCSCTPDQAGDDYCHDQVDHNAKCCYRNSQKCTTYSTSCVCTNDRAGNESCQHIGAVCCKGGWCRESPDQC